MIKILEENDFFIVLRKPEAFSVHNQSPSVAEFLTARKKPLHFVNRLDQETSGLMVVAREPEGHLELADSLENGKKFYRALLRSPWKASEKSVLWKKPISDKAEGYKNPQGLSAHRVDASTKVQIVRSNQYFTEIYAELLTGRQHQIRKHAAIAKHPVVGDPRYNEKKYNDNIAKHYAVKRMHLHAEKLEFSFRGKNYVFEDPYKLDVFFRDRAPSES